MCEYEATKELPCQVKVPWLVSLCQLWKTQKTVIYNLTIMIIAWSCVSFSFFLINFFIKYLPGDVYQNQTISGLASVAFLCAGPMSKALCNRSILVIAFFIAFVSSTTLLIVISFSTENSDTSALSLIILLTRCGINIAFCFVFVIHTEIFPTAFLGTSYGICNFFCRTVTLSAPLVAESANKVFPLATLVGATLIGTLCCLSLKKIDKRFERCENDTSIMGGAREDFINHSILK